MATVAAVAMVAAVAGLMSEAKGDARDGSEDAKPDAGAGRAGASGREWAGGEGGRCVGAR